MQLISKFAYIWKRDQDLRCKEEGRQISTDLSLHISHLVTAACKSEIRNDEMGPAKTHLQVNCEQALAVAVLFTGFDMRS